MRCCKECGTQVSEQALFCKECGARLKQDDMGAGGQPSATVAAERGSSDEASVNSGTEPMMDSTTAMTERTGLEHEFDPPPQVSSSVSSAQAESATAASAVSPAGLRSVSASAAPSARMSRTQKIIMLLGVLLLVILFGGYKAGEYFTSEERLIGRFEKALESGDHNAVAQLLSSKNEDLVIDGKSITGFMSYLERNPEEMKMIIDTLKEQAAAGEEAEKDMSLTDLFSRFGLNGIVNLEKSGKVLFYDKYTLTMDAVYISVETNYAGTVLSVNGQQAAVADAPDYKTKLGPYVPGLYQLEAKFKNDYVDLKNSEDVQLLDSKQSYGAYLELDGEVVRWDTRFSENTELNGRLYINGKKVEVNPFQNPEFGPVTTDGSMTLAVEADFPWGTVKSAEVKIEDDYIDLDFTRQESFQAGIKDTIVKHAKENLDAFASGDTGRLTISTDKYREVLQSIVDQFKESGYAYKSTYVGTVFDIGSFDLDFQDGVWQITLITQPLIEAATYIEGETPTLQMQKAFSETGLLYDEDQGIWKVDFIANSWGFKTEELEEYKEEKPVIYKSAWNEKAAPGEDSPEETDIKLIEVQQFMTGYVKTYVEAIGSRDFNLVSGMLDPKGPAYQETSAYLDNMEKVWMKNAEILVEVRDFKKISENTYEVTTSEVYDIQFEDGTKKSDTVTASYTLSVVNGKLRVYEMLSS